MQHPIWVGVDPGGANAFGIAIIAEDGEVTTACVPTIRARRSWPSRPASSSVPRPVALLLQRPDSGAWDLPGGAVRDGEDAEVAALRGALECTGYRAAYVHGMHCRTLNGGRVTAVPLRELEDEFTPRLSPARHVAFMWADPRRVIGS
jgi:8-oxo-dGTP pyrophosphatase MutT (NUDIX family)